MKVYNVNPCSTLKRIILDDYTVQTRVNEAFTVDVRYIVTVLVTGETKTTLKVDRVLVRAYVNGSLKLSGLECRYTGCKHKRDGWRRQDLSISKKRNKALNKISSEFKLDQLKRDASNYAIREYFYSLPEMDGIVSWFSGDRGRIAIPSLGTSFDVYACNIKGAKTWYPNTACMYLNKGDKVKVQLVALEHGPSCQVTEGGHFDSEKWASLDHDRLAFKCDENGNAINGLFR